MEPPDKIVVVDDDVDIARFVEVNLKLQGYDVLIAHDGEAALQLIAAHEPALAIVDWMMPKLDGLELIRQLRADPMTAPLPVILLTARTSPAFRYAGLATGANRHVLKPFNPADLVALVRELLDHD